MPEPPANQPGESKPAPPVPPIRPEPVPGEYEDGQFVVDPFGRRLNPRFSSGCRPTHRLSISATPPT